MLYTLDIVIAFAVIMTVLSVMITIIVQMVSAALSLRGKNLANALSLTFQTIDPHIGEKANSLAAQILRDPIFSDSIFQVKKRVVVPLANAATQAVIDAERVLKAAELALARNQDAAKAADLDQEVKKAQAAVDEKKAKPGVLKRQVEPNREEPWGFWTWPWGGAAHLGSAIRPGEVYRVLHELAALTETEAALRNVPAKLVRTATTLLEELRKTDRPALESREKLVVIREVSKFFTNPEQQKAVIDSLGNFGATVERATTQAYDRFQRWFGSGQDRAEQWFQTHVRIVTIVMAILTAFFLQLDTIQIFQQLRAQPKLVEALVKSTPDVLKEGGTVLDPSNTAAYHTYLLWLDQHPLFELEALPAKGDQAAYRQALAERLKKKGDSNYLVQQFDRSFDQARNVEGVSENTDAAAAKTAYEAWLKRFPDYKLDPEPDFAGATKDSIRGAIQEKIAAAPAAGNPPSPDNAKEMLDAFDGLQPAGTLAFEKARNATFNSLKRDLEDAGFDLAPPSFLGRWKGEEVPKWIKGCPLLGQFLVHFLGVMMTAGLLSLGAPFWFNLLKNLTNLRPAVAALVEKRPTSAPALPAAPATPPSPS